MKAAGVAGQTSTVATDPDRRAAGKAAISLTRFWWDLAHKDQGREQAREGAAVFR